MAGDPAYNVENHSHHCNQKLGDLRVMNRIIALSIFMMSLCLVGCRNAGIQIAIAEPEETRSGSETLDIRNCDNNDEMVTNLAAHAPVKQDISISETATSEKTGQDFDIPLELLDEIKVQIKTFYQPVLEEALTQTEAVVFTIPGNKIHMYKIQWIQQQYRSEVSLTINGQSCSTSYVYTLDIPKLDSLTTMACTA
jgi:hypothetical protein